ncbi:alpha/beta hydrolase-fold protein [uncultured Psychroserpens sp.]|uniref:alpha/beta hydrolase-fold protein n=1 Tax=uncultured Psychroserpens sp. TaxID=255436 RepID=UPI0026098671|nr:alpha/beta hydrolase-fold protein [uncultured Psychroserpens sp.]
MLVQTTYSQIIKTNTNVGETITLKSEILKENREIQIFLPDSYQETDNTYPVLYVLDGQRYFLHAVSLHKTFVGFRQTPEFIIVGITKKQSERNRNFSSNAKTFLNAIEQDIIQYVDTNYRTSEDRLLFGWAYAGGFTIEALINKPNLFNAYIAASPFPASEKINAVDSLISHNTNFDKLLYFTSDINEGVVRDGTIALNELLINKAPESMRWNFREFIGEEHISTPFSTLYHGMITYFEYYPELQFNTLKEFLNAGGLESVYSYYQKRASRYGFPAELSDWTMFSITRNAMRADDFEQFDKLVNTFQPTDFMSRLRVSRACSIAEFYLKHKQYDRAIDLFNLLAEKHPNAVQPLYGLGDTYKALKKERKSSLYYKKAEKLSKTNSN